jgi:hypothetical protein
MEALVQDEFINISHVSEAILRFNGYWANDYTVCDSIADKYGYDRTKFTNEVYRNVTF